MRSQNSTDPLVLLPSFCFDYPNNDLAIKQGLSFSAHKLILRTLTKLIVADSGVRYSVWTSPTIDKGSLTSIEERCIMKHENSLKLFDDLINALEIVINQDNKENRGHLRIVLQNYFKSGFLEKAVNLPVSNLRELAHTIRERKNLFIDDLKKNEYDLKDFRIIIEINSIPNHFVIGSDARRALDTKTDLDSMARPPENINCFPGGVSLSQISTIYVDEENVDVVKNIFLQNNHGVRIIGIKRVDSLAEHGIEFIETCSHRYKDFTRRDFLPLIEDGLLIPLVSTGYAPGIYSRREVVKYIRSQR
jgi:hypothetical protein